MQHRKAHQQHFPTLYLGISDQIYKKKKFKKAFLVPCLPNYVVEIYTFITFIMKCMMSYNVLYVFERFCLLYRVPYLFLNRERKRIVSNFIFNHNNNDDNGEKGLYAQNLYVYKNINIKADMKDNNRNFGHILGWA